MRRLRARAAIGRVRGAASAAVRRRVASGRGTARPAPVGVLTGLDLAGLVVLDVGPTEGAVVAAATRAGAARAVAAPGLDVAAGPADVVVVRNLHRAADPAGTAWRLRELARGVAVVATPATEWPGHEERGLLEIRPGDAAGPVAWSPSADGVRELLLAAGFVDIRVVAGPPPYRRRGWRPVHYGLVVHARP